MDGAKGTEADNVAGSGGGPVLDSPYTLQTDAPSGAAGTPGEISTIPAVLRKMAGLKCWNFSDLNRFSSGFLWAGQHSSVTQSVSRLCRVKRRLPIKYRVPAYASNNYDETRDWMRPPSRFCSQYIKRQRTFLSDDLAIGHDHNKAPSDSSESRSAENRSQESSIEEQRDSIAVTVEAA